MRVSFLKPLYERSGPFTSIYLDATRTTEDAGKAAALRWRALREQLDDADSRALGAIEAVVEATFEERRSGGLVAFAAGPEIVYTELMSVAPRAEAARVGDLPHVFPYLAQRGEPVSYMVVVADRLGAELVRVSAGGVRRETHVAGPTDFPIRKATAGEVSRPRHQRAAEESRHLSAKEVAHEVDRLARRDGPEIVMVAGDVRARNEVMECLPADVQRRAVDVGTGSEDEIQRVLALKSDQRVEDTVDRFRAQLANRRRAVEGVAETTAALSRAQVEDLLVEDHADGRGDLRGEDGMLRYLVESDGALLVVPPGTLACESGVGALLRY